MSDEVLPAQFFARQDEREDAAFYREPRFVTHIDDATISNLTAYYREVLPAGTRICDLMSSWISHLPGDVQYQRVEGLGMNADELRRNPRLDAYTVHDLNASPVLPYASGAFDAVLIAVSVQYLVRPFEVFSEIMRVLAPEGHCIVAMSHRLFPTKAVMAFHVLPPAERCRLVASYMHRGGMDRIRSVDRSPPVADPLWIVHGRRPAGAAAT